MAKYEPHPNPHMGKMPSTKDTKGCAVKCNQPKIASPFKEIKRLI